jgi:hypothetical protein
MLVNTMCQLDSSNRDRSAVRSRLRRMCAAVASFAVGAAAGVFLFSAISNWCFALPQNNSPLKRNMISNGLTSYLVLNARCSWREQFPGGGSVFNEAECAVSQSDHCVYFLRR